MLIHEMGQTWMLIIILTFFIIAATTMFSTFGYTILMLLIWKKTFFSTIFLIINVHPWNEMNLDTHNNFHSFCYGNYNNFLLIGIHDIDALDLQEKVLSTIFLIIKVQLWNETNTDAYNNLRSFCYWHYNHVLTLGDTILML